MIKKTLCNESGEKSYLEIHEDDLDERDLHQQTIRSDKDSSSAQMVTNAVNNDRINNLYGILSLNVG